MDSEDDGMKLEQSHRDSVKLEIVRLPERTAQSTEKVQEVSKGRPRLIMPLTSKPPPPEWIEAFQIGKHQPHEYRGAGTVNRHNTGEPLFRFHIYISTTPA